MTADRRYTIREAADLADVSTDTVRRRYRAGLLPGAGTDEGDPTGTIYIPHEALVTAGLVRPDTAAATEPDDVIGRRRAERERDADHDELVTLRAENAGLLAQLELLQADLRHAQKLAQTLASALERGRAA